MPTVAPPRLRPRPCVLLDADVLFTGAAGPSEHGASLILLRMAEITLIQGVTPQQVVAEAERNLSHKLPKALPAFHLIVSRCLHVVADPDPADLVPFTGLADPKDLPILVTAIREACPWLVTFNVQHFQPGHPSVKVVRPGELVLRVRDQLARLGGRSP